MSFPLPPGYRIIRRKTRYLCLDPLDRRISHTLHDTRDWRLMLWEWYCFGALAA